MSVTALLTHQINDNNKSQLYREKFSKVEDKMEFENVSVYGELRKFQRRILILFLRENVI